MMGVSVNAGSAGKLTVNVLGDRLLTTQTTDMKEGTAQVKIPVGKDWGTGAYVVATLRRPLDAAALRMPGRAIGLKWFGIDKNTRTLQVNLSPPALVRPNTTLKLPVKLGGLNPGEDAKIVVAAVDVGILNLTNYKPPAPDDYYLGQRRLTAEVRDLYGQLIDGMQGTRGQLKTGGDSAGAELQGAPPTQRPRAPRPRARPPPISTSTSRARMVLRWRGITRSTSRRRRRSWRGDRSGRLPRARA